jgi:hypothetical protein
MKLVIAVLSLLAVQSASANTLGIRLVPCTNSESICAKVYKDSTANVDYKGSEMTYIGDGEIRAQIYAAAQAFNGQMLQVEGKVFPVFSGDTYRVKIERILSAAPSAPAPAAATAAVNYSVTYR